MKRPAPVSEDSATTSDASNHSGPTPDTPGEASVTVSFYKQHEKIYPREVDNGHFSRLRTIAGVVLLGLFYGVPWLRLEGQQLLLFDLPARQFHIFGLTFLPQDFVYLTGLLILAALSLFMFTALAGRLWCGYACPQTVWTEAFIWMERKIEGNRSRQMKRDAEPMSGKKFRRKALKHAVWILFSLWTGFTFVGYFTSITDLGWRTLTFDLGGWEAFWVVFYGFATYGNAGWMREQVCTYMCPYARFQSAMFDNSTLIIAYDDKRGEPRGSRSRNADREATGLGDCINCTLCVQVCPTGIDIRDGLQYQCIACAACIDVCDQVMEQMDYPKGLISYTSALAMEGKPARLIGPRIIVYGVLLLTLSGTLIAAVALRVPVELDVLRDRMSLYREIGDQRIENVYSMKLINKTDSVHSFVLEATGLPGITLLMDTKTVSVPAGGVSTIAARIQVDGSGLTAVSSPFVIRMQSSDDESLRAQTAARFLGPRQ